MIPWNDMVMCEERYKDYMREAARERLVREANAGQPKGLPFLARVTAWLKHHSATGVRKSHRMLAGPSRA
jgi:hypothetical protein